MLLKELIKSENTYGLLDQWEAYRKQLTDYIIDCIEDYNIKEYLRANRKLRLSGDYEKRGILNQEDKKVLAIWGAGSSGDMDLKELSTYFKLVLIDRDLDSMKLARNRYGLSAEDCILVDLGFWDISIEDYELFEAMLIDKVSATDINRFLQDIVDGMPELDYSDIPKFDYSVGVGIASQLNSRFMALLKLYQESYQGYNMEDLLLIKSKLELLNGNGVKRLVEAMRLTTKELIMVGYEIGVYGKAEADKMEMQFEALTKDLEEKEEAGFLGVWDSYKVDIAGSRELHNLLNGLVSENVLYEFSENYMIWSFLKEKSYIMSVRAFLELGLEV